MGTAARPPTIRSRAQLNVSHARSEEHMFIIVEAGPPSLITSGEKEQI